MNRRMITAIMVLFSPHHALGVHASGLIITGTRDYSGERKQVSDAAFVCTAIRHVTISEKRGNVNYSPLVPFQLGYSTDEDGTSIHNYYHWLQTTSKQGVFSSSEIHTHIDDRQDHFVGDDRWEASDMSNDKDNVDKIDYSTTNNDVLERRNRRLRSLKSFNQATARHQNWSAFSSRKINWAETMRGTSFSNKLTMENDLPELPYNDLSQLQAIRSNAPAILLPSGPGTGKTHVLSLRIAYLLRKHVMKRRKRLWSSESDADDNNLDANGEEYTTPDSIVILSFTNRDAERLKERALDCLFPPHNKGDVNVSNSQQIWRNEISRQLWSGTMHAFSLAILNKYGPSSSPLKVLPAREMRNRVSASIRSLMIAHDGRQASSIKMLQSLHLQALNDVGHSRSILYQNIVRCIDLWKEAGIPLTSPEPSSVAPAHEVDGTSAGDDIMEDYELQQRELHVVKSCLELAMRLGIPKSSALLALDVFPAFQAWHAEAGTADPSDLAGMAYRLLLAQPESLRLLQSKLKHIIVDEYQDMSVSQHNLLRLVVRGIVDEEETVLETSGMHKKRKIALRQRQRLPVLLEPNEQKRKFKASSRYSNAQQSYTVPSIFCAGDASQSIYGWRGGSPELTIHGFRRDYPQGIVAQLAVCYRLPNDIAEAAERLFPLGLAEAIPNSNNVSPAAAAKVASALQCSPNPIVSTGAGQRPVEEHFRLGNQLLLSKGMQKIDSTVIIHGLWDAREEAKYIASTIRRRSKERKNALISALINLDNAVTLPPADELMDLTDVAVMVRSSSQLHLLKEALGNAGIPFTSNENYEGDARTKENDETKKWLIQKRARMVKSLPMKPVFLITMHRSKGEEFDDVYLAGWTEGEFPHHDAVSSNRVHEERRLAYVALTRARQRVVITHSFVKRVLNYGRDGRKKYVTEQVQPSRFLYELKPSKRVEDGATSSSDMNDPLRLTSNDDKGTVWDRSRGIKEFVAGQNLPNSFQVAYQQPRGYVAKRADFRPNIVRVSSCTSAENLLKTPIQVIETGFKDIVTLRKKGATKKYAPIFKEMLASFFQIKRGNALVFASGATSKETLNESVYALLEAPAEDLVQKPISQCTAMQIGHFLAFLILKPKTEAMHLGPLQVIENGLNDIVTLRKKGASKRYILIFKEMLASLFEIRRGNALVLKSGAKQARNKSVRTLADAPANEMVKKPLGKCTATQLGHYIAFLLITSESVEQKLM